MDHVKIFIRNISSNSKTNFDNFAVKICFRGQNFDARSFEVKNKFQILRIVLEVNKTLMGQISNLTLTRPISLPPHAPVTQKIADQR